jgi:hypothetical protein
MNDPIPDPSGGVDGSRASALFHGATTDFVPDVDRLVQGGVARGRTLRRRRRVGTSLAAVAVVGILGVAAGAGSQLVGGDLGSTGSLYADTPSGTPSSTPSAAPSPPSGATSTLPVDAEIAVAAADVPGIVAELLPAGTLGETLLDPPYGIADQRQKKIVHFVYDDTLTSFIIERADSLATCAEQVDPANQADGEPGGQCVEEDGVTLLTWGPETADGVTAQGVSAFVHGYVVTAISYNAIDGKDATPVSVDPAISMESLTTLVTSERWFG